MMRKQTTVFEEVSSTGYKTIPCAGECGRRLRRQKKFSQTLNPFNKNAVGMMKTEDEILDELVDQIKEWQSESELCKKCRKK